MRTEFDDERSQQRKWLEQIDLWRRRLPSWLWEALLDNGRDKPCTCKDDPALLCWHCVAVLEDERKKHIM